MSETLHYLELSPLERLQNYEAVAARDVIDRNLIELKAQQLIDRHAQYEWEHLAGEDYNNAVTSLFEELRAAGDLSELDFTGNQDEIHAATMARLLNGYATPAPTWEKQRRFAEICEELTLYEVYRSIKNGELPDDIKLVVISDFPDDAETDEAAHAIGYRARNHKGMVRVYSFSTDAFGRETRHVEQLSRSNADTSASTRGWFNQNLNLVPLHATGALHEQLLMTQSRLPDGVVTMMRELDEASGGDVVYGETFAEAAMHKRPSYESVRAVSLAARQREYALIKELEEHEKYLNQLLQDGHIDYNQKLERFHRKQHQIIERILVQAPEKYAHDARGAETVQYYAGMHQALLSGDLYQYHMNRNFADSARDKLAGGSCGSSGIQSTNTDSSISPDETILTQFTADSDAREEGNWSWKKGYCRVEQCTNKGSMTEVGPCNVCRDCQKKFDKNDKWTESASRSVHKTAGTFRKIGDILFTATTKKLKEPKHA